MKINSFLVKIIIAAIIAVVAVASFFAYFKWSAEPQYQGQLVFNHTYDSGDKVDKIIIDNANGSVELNKIDGYWRLGNFDNYFADFNTIKTFLDMLNSSIYVMAIPSAKGQKDNVALQNPLKQKEFAGTLVRTYAQGKLLNEIIIGLRASENKNYFARNPNSDDVWLISWDHDIPLVAQDWLPHPILDIPNAAIEILSIDRKNLTRQISSDKFRDRFNTEIDIDWLLYNLTSFDIDEVLSQKSFETRYPDVDVKKIYDITTFYGLIFEVLFYDGGDDKAWVNIKLSADNLPKAAVHDYIKDNSFLFDGWYFSVSPRQKDFLLNYDLF